MSTWADNKEPGDKFTAVNEGVLAYTGEQRIQVEISVDDNKMNVELKNGDTINLTKKGEK